MFRGSASRGALRRRVWEAPVDDAVRAEPRDSGWKRCRPSPEHLGLVLVQPSTLCGPWGVFYLLLLALDPPTYLPHPVPMVSALTDLKSNF